MIHGMVKSGVFFLLKNVANALHATNNLQIIPDFSLKDSRDQTVLGLALWTGKAVSVAADRRAPEGGCAREGGGRVGANRLCRLAFLFGLSL